MMAAPGEFLEGLAGGLKGEQLSLFPAYTPPPRSLKRRKKPQQAYDPTWYAATADQPSVDVRSDLS